MLTSREAIISKVIRHLEGGCDRAEGELQAKEGRVPAFVGLDAAEIKSIFDEAEARIRSHQPLPEPQVLQCDVQPALEALKEELGREVFVFEAEDLATAEAWIRARLSESDLADFNKMLVQRKVKKLSYSDIAHVMVVHADSVANNEDRSSPRSRFLKIANSHKMDWDKAQVRFAIRILEAVGFARKTRDASRGQAEQYELLVDLF